MSTTPGCIWPSDAVTLHTSPPASLSSANLHGPESLRQQSEEVGGADHLHHPLNRILVLSGADARGKEMKGCCLQLCRYVGTSLFFICLLIYLVAHYNYISSELSDSSKAPLWFGSRRLSEENLESKSNCELCPWVQGGRIKASLTVVIKCRCCECDALYFSWLLHFFFF